MATQPELAAARSRLRRLREIEAALREVGVPPHPAIDLEIASLDVTSLLIVVPCALCGSGHAVTVFVDAPGADALDDAICAACDRAAAAPAGTAPIGRQL